MYAEEAGHLSSRLAKGLLKGTAYFCCDEAAVGKRKVGCSSHGLQVVLPLFAADGHAG